MKRRITIISLFLLMAILILPNVTMADEVKTTNQLQDLTGRVVTDSLEILQIDLANKALEVKYEDKIKSYNESKDALSKYENDVIGAAYNLEVAQKMYKAANNDEERIAASNNASNILSRYMVAKNSFKGRVNGYIAQMKQAEPLILQKKQGVKAKQDEVEKLKYTFQKDYFDLMTGGKELEMLKQDLINIRKQYEAERIKLNYGLTTDDKVNDLSKKVTEIYNSLDDQESAVNQLNDNMKTRLNMAIDDILEIEYQIPQIEYIKEYRLKELLENFNKYNVDLEAIKLNEDVLKESWEKYKIAYKLDDPYITATKSTLDKEDSDLLLTAEYDYLKATYDAKTASRNTEMYVKKSYYAYQKAFKAYKSALNNSKALDDKLGIASSNFATGNISELQYTVQKQELARGKFDVEKAAINFVNAAKQMELVNQGIWLK